MMLRRMQRLIFMLSALLPITSLALDDPTRPPGEFYIGAETAEDAVAGAQLSSILISAGRRLAIINGQTVRQGQQVGNVRVVKIEPTAVIVIENGERKRLALLPSGVKKVTK